MSAAPNADDLLMGGGSGGGERGAPRVGRADLELLKIMWKRIGWDGFIPDIPDIERNPTGRTDTQRRRPRVVPPGRADALLYNSPSNTAKLPSNEHLLNKWKLRQVLLGAALDPGIQDLVIANQDDKDKLNELVYKAMNRAGSERGADQGTARHKIAAMLDFGIDPGPLSPSLRADMDAYRAATRGLDMVLGETFVVDDANKMGGTFDRVVHYQGRNYIADLKPPESGFGQDAHAIQFAIYSRAVLYNWNLAQHLLHTNPKALPTTQLRAELPQPLDQERAIVIYVPRNGIGRASTSWVDISAGWEGFQHAQWMRRWQSPAYREGLVTPFEPKAPPTVIDVAPTAPGGDHLLRGHQAKPAPAGPTAANPGATRLDGKTDRYAGDDDLLDQIAAAADLDGLKAIYARHRAVWTAELTAAYKARRDVVTGEAPPPRGIADGLAAVVAAQRDSVRAERAAGLAAVVAAMQRPVADESDSTSTAAPETAPADPPAVPTEGR